MTMKKGDQRVLLSFQRGQGDRRHRRDHQGGLSRPDRQDRQIRLRRHQGRQAAEDAGDAGRDQGRQEARRHGAGEIFAAVGAAGHGGRVEDRLQDGRAVTVTALSPWGRCVGWERRTGAVPTINLLAMNPTWWARCALPTLRQRSELKPPLPSPPAPAAARAWPASGSPSWSRRSARGCRPRTR